MRTLGIDLGTRRIGLAISDESGEYVTPHDVLHVTDPLQALAPIARLVKDEAIARVVIGLPLNMDDSFGPAARKSVEWGSELARQTSAQIIYVDERLSSFDAEQSLNDRKRAGEKMTRRTKKAQLDALAAAAFLRDYLAGRSPALDV